MYSYLIDSLNELQIKVDKSKENLNVLYLPKFRPLFDWLVFFSLMQIPFEDIT